MYRPMPQQQKNSALITRQAYDGHLNMVLSDVEETVTIVEVEEDNVDAAVRVSLPFSNDTGRAFVFCYASLFCRMLLIDRLSRKGRICCLCGEIR